MSITLRNFIVNFPILNFRGYNINKSLWSLSRLYETYRQYIDHSTFEDLDVTEYTVDD